MLVFRLGYCPGCWTTIAPRPEVLAALPIFPLPNAVLLPGMVLPLNVFEPRYLELVDFALDNDQHVGVPLLRPGFEEDYEGRPDFEEVFGIGRMLSHQPLPDGRRFIRLEGLRRVQAIRELSTGGAFRQVQAELLPEGSPEDDYQLEVLKAQLERIAGTLRPDDQQLVSAIVRIPDDRMLVYAAAAILPTLGLLPDVPDRRPLPTAHAAAGVPRRRDLRRPRRKSRRMLRLDLRRPQRHGPLPALDVQLAE